LGLLVNYFNPEGIPLVREKLELKWAPDSLFLELDQNSGSDKIDSSSLAISENSIESIQKDRQDSEVLKEDSKESTSDLKKKSEDKDEVIAFAEPKAINIDQAYTLYNKDIIFIDARDEADFLVGHITNSINIPFDNFDNHKQKLELLSKEKPMVIYCAGTDCDLSILLGNLLFEQGYKQVYIFFGGWNEWLNAKYPVENSSEEK
jgi:rhodanese-related sulfurtransferase